MVINCVYTWLQVSNLTVQGLPVKECGLCFFLSHGWWSPFTMSRGLPIPPPSGPIGSWQNWWLSISQEMRWNIPLPVMRMMMRRVIAHLLWIVRSSGKLGCVLIVPARSHACSQECLQFMEMHFQFFCLAFCLLGLKTWPAMFSYWSYLTFFFCVHACKAQTAWWHGLFQIGPNCNDPHFSCWDMAAATDTVSSRAFCCFLQSMLWFMSDYEGVQ